MMSNGSKTEPRRITRSFDDILYYPNHTASDFYHHYKEDIALMKEMGFRVFRMSISWSLIYLTGTEEIPNESGLAFYDKVFTELKKAGIEPLVTISHYESPFYLTEKYNGWSDRKLIEYYLRFCQSVFNRYKDKVKYWLTFNEINAAMYSFGGYSGLGILNEGTTSMDDQEDIPQLRFQGLHHQLVASAKAVSLGHSINPDFKIGCMVAITVNYAYSCNPEDQLANQKSWEYCNYYCSDVQVRGEYPYFAKRIWEENNVNIKMEPLISFPFPIT